MKRVLEILLRIDTILATGCDLGLGTAMYYVAFPLSTYVEDGAWLHFLVSILSLVGLVALVSVLRVSYRHSLLALERQQGRAYRERYQKVDYWLASVATFATFLAATLFIGVRAARLYSVVQVLGLTFYGILGSMVQEWSTLQIVCMISAIVRVVLAVVRFFLVLMIDRREEKYRSALYGARIF